MIWMIILINKYSNDNFNKYSNEHMDEHLDDHKTKTKVCLTIFWQFPTKTTHAIGIASQET